MRVLFEWMRLDLRGLATNTICSFGAWQGLALTEVILRRLGATLTRSTMSVKVLDPSCDPNRQDQSA